MPMTYDPIFAVDPANPANVAKNATITIFDPADVAQSPVAITDPTGSPLPNPMTLDAAGMGPAFQHPTLARVGWKGAGFVGYFTSYEGMYNETMAAKEAAQAAVSSAASAASTAVAEVSTALAGAVADAEAAAIAAAKASALVGAPADSAIAAAMTGSGATKTALTNAITSATAGKLDTAGVNQVISSRIRTSASRTIVFGDSIDAAVQGWYAYYALGSKVIRTIRNAGIAGNTTTMMKARLQSDVLAYNPDVVVMGSVTNDHQQGFPAATTQANIVEMVNSIRATGATVILRTTTPADQVGVAPYETLTKRRQAILTHNSWLRSYAATQGIDVLDVYQSVADPATGGFLPGISSDSLHPTETGYKAIADYLLGLPIPSAWRGGFPFARAVTDTSNMVTNGVFVGDSNADGLANNWTLSVGTPTFSLTPAAAGITGNWQRVTTSTATAAAIIQDFTTGYSTGDIVEVAGRVRTSGTATAIVRFAAWGAAQGWSDPVASTTKALDGVFSGSFTVPGDLTKIRVQVQTGGAPGWIEVAEVAMRNLTKLGLV